MVTLFLYCRLGLYLVTRVLKDGQDRRFNKIRNNRSRFFLAWTLQGIIILLSLISGVEPAVCEMGSLLWQLKEKNSSTNYVFRFLFKWDSSELHHGLLCICP